MKRKIIWIVVILLAILGGLAFYYFFGASGQGANGVKLNFDDPNDVFDVQPLSDFDEARLARFNEKFAAAKDLYEKKPNETWTWIVIGNLYEFVKDYDRAILAYEKVLAIQDLEVISLNNLGYIYENNKKDFSKAEYYYKRILNTYSTVPDYHINLARLYDLKMGESAKAEGAYLSGLRQTSNNPDLLVATVRFYQNHGNESKASEYADLLLKLYPENQAYQNDFAGLIKK